MRTVAIIGVGRLGGALAIAFDRLGIIVEHLISHRPRENSDLLSSIKVKPRISDLKSLEEIHSDLIFITTPDDRIAATAERVAERLDRASVVFHCSGAISSGVLAVLAARGNPTGSFHPLVSISDPVMGAAALRKAFFCLEGTETAVSAGQEIASLLGGATFSVSDRLRPLYHASAVMAAGHITSLFASAARMMEECGLSGRDAERVLMPLVRSTIENISSVGSAKALTGPFGRGDSETVSKHITAFSESGLQAEERAYLALGICALKLASGATVPDRQIERIEKAIMIAMAKLR